MLGIEHLPQGQQMGMLSNHMHYSYFLVHEVEIFVAGVSADNLHSHCFGRLLIPSKHDIGIGSTAEIRFLGFAYSPCVASLLKKRSTDIAEAHYTSFFRAS